MYQTLYLDICTSDLENTDCLKVVVVANYSPAGNYIGQYVDNVPPPQ